MLTTNYLTPPRGLVLDNDLKNALILAAGPQSNRRTGPPTGAVFSMEVSKFAFNFQYPDVLRL